MNVKCLPVLRPTTVTGEAFAFIEGGFFAAFVTKAALSRYFVYSQKLLIMKTDTCSSSRRAAHKHVKMTDTLLFSDLCRIRQKNASKSTLDILHSLTVIMGELYGNDIPVKNITQTFCRRLLRFMESRKLAPGTIRTYLAAMQSLLRMVNGFRVPDIARLMPRRQQSVKEALEPDDIKKLTDTPCRHQSTAEAFFFALQTGLRYSDIASLCWGDIVCRGGSQYVYKRMVKTGNMVKVPLSDKALEIVEMLAKRQGVTVEKADKECLVFYDLMSYSTIRNDLRQWAEAAELPLDRLTFHLSRHTFASALHTNHTPLATISRMLGHQSLLTTETYLHSFDSDEKNAINFINNYGTYDYEQCSTFDVQKYNYFLIHENNFCTNFMKTIYNVDNQVCIISTIFQTTISLTKKNVRFCKSKILKFVNFERCRPF